MFPAGAVGSFASEQLEIIKTAPTAKNARKDKHIFTFNPPQEETGYSAHLSCRTTFAGTTVDLATDVS